MDNDSSKTPENLNDLTARIAALSPEKRALLDLRLKNNGTRASAEKRILRVAARDSVPLSFSQQRLWFLDQYEPNSSVYNVPSAQRLQGPLDIGALERSLREIMRRHEALRTTFSTADGEPVQVIAPPPSFSLPVLDLTCFSDGERENEAQRLATAEAQLPFDLSQGPLFRASLLRLGETDHVLLCTMHHIVSDGWSMGVLHRELSALYQAFTRGKPSPLPDLPIQYADYAVWQRECLKGEEVDRQLSYWKRQLEGAPGVLDLPTDRPRPAVQSHRGGRQSIALSRHPSEKLKGLSRKVGVTLYMTLLAGFQTLLYRYTGQDNIVVGSPIANRTRTEIEGLIGFFVNTLVLRSNFANSPTFKELLAQVRETALGAYAHQDLPFEKLVEELQPERNLSYSPLFQVMFVLQNTPSTQLKFEGLTVNPVRLGGETAKFDLLLSLHEEAEGLRASLQYNTDLFDEATITRMLGHFRTLLEGIVADPNQRVSELPLLSEPEKHQVLVEWNDTAADYPKDKCIHQLFEEQVEKTPDAVALVFEDQRLTYRELNSRANQLAHYLRKLGVGPEVAVGICVERTAEMVVGLLGILKAGGAYVPLDRAYPTERISFILRDAQAAVLLTEEGLADIVGHDSLDRKAGRVQCDDQQRSNPDLRLKVIFFDRERAEVNAEGEENLPGQATASNLAYVIYTSGSTGLPKGVMIEHRSVAAFLSWARSVFAKDELAGVVASTSICFDLSAFELFAPLTSGGRVILVENALAVSGMDPALEPTLINTVPSVIAELLRVGQFPASIRTVNLAGEPLKTSLVRDIYQQTSARRVYDLYGPSETTTYSTYAQRTPEGVSTIGKPIGNTKVYILDSHLNPVPIGVAGELYIGGEGLARGYLNRSELTAEKFITNPFSANPASRLYRTGDLARYRADGNIEFIGRLDNQVKLRGYRIELGEIEAVISQHPTVREAVAMVREDTPGDKRLVAYVAGDGPRAVEPDALKTFLKARLPDYMVPSAWVLLDAMPRTANGKTDLKSLPKPQQSQFETKGKFVGPRNQTEELLAQVWAEVLGRARVGIHDNFFALGGHSLLATQVVSRLRNAFKLDLPLRTIFESPTIEELALAISHIQAREPGREALSRILDEVEDITESVS